MFERVGHRQRPDVVISVDGVRTVAKEGDTVAAALLAAGLLATRRTPVSGAPRGPYCMMGACFECLVTIDDAGNRQACLIPVRAGMRISTQHSRREAGR
jgi:predicted molibdopterin-dependent oxidoreductase YjgC